MKLLLKLKDTRMKNIFKLVLLVAVVMPTFLVAQTNEKNKLVVAIKYYNDNNKIPYLVIQTKSKIDGKFQKIGNIPLTIYITSELDKNNVIANGVSSERGECIVLIPPKAKLIWRTVYSISCNYNSFSLFVKSIEFFFTDRGLVLLGVE